MALWRFVNLNLKEAQLLADLSGIEEDLEMAESICILLEDEIAKKSHLDRYLVYALSSAALVSYARAFSSGVRAKLPGELDQLLSAELLVEHNYFMDLRNKYVAHSVNAFEDHQVVAYLIPEERGEKGISSISVQQTRLVCLDSTEIEKMRLLCATLLKHAKEVIVTETAKVLEIAKALPMDDLYSQEDPPPRFPLKKEAGKSRRKL